MISWTKQKIHLSKATCYVQTPYKSIIIMMCPTVKDKINKEQNICSWESLPEEPGSTSSHAYCTERYSSCSQYQNSSNLVKSWATAPVVVVGFIRFYNYVIVSICYSDNQKDYVWQASLLWTDTILWVPEATQRKSVAATMPRNIWVWLKSLAKSMRILFDTSQRK